MMSGLDRLAPLSQQRASLSKQRTSDAQGAARSNSDEAYIYRTINDETDDDPPRRGVKRKPKIAVPEENGFNVPQISLRFDYSKFHDEFRRSFSRTLAFPAVAESTNSSVADSERSSQQPDSNGHMSNSSTKRNESSVIPAKRPGAAMAKSFKRVKSNDRASLAVEDRSVTPAEGPSVEKKARPPRPKGSGIYKTGTWDYVSAEDPPAEQITKVVDEISSVTEAAAQKPVKVTRNQYLKLKSMVKGSTPAPTPSQEAPIRSDGAAVGEESTIREPRSPTGPLTAMHISPEPQNSKRRSNRKRPIPNYSTAIAPELDEDPPTPAASPSHRAAKRQKTSPTTDSPVTQENMPATIHATNSASDSITLQPDPEVGQSVRPKLSWTMIVYEVIANAKTPTLSLAEIIEGVKDRFPYFRSDAHTLTLKSSTRNPIYKHPAFYRVLRADGTMACGLNPGNFYDVKSNKLLTAGLPNPSATSSAQVSEQSGRKKSRKATAPSDAPVSNPHIDERSAAVEPPPDDLIRSGDANTANSFQQSSDNTAQAARTSDSEHDGHSASPDQSGTRLSTVGTNINEESSDVATSKSLTVHTDSQVQAERLPHAHLAETFTTEEMHQFHQATKRTYFKNLQLNREDVSYILSEIFPIWLNQPDSDLEECARDLQKMYEEDTWATDSFLEFVSEEVTRFDTLMSMNYMDKDRPARLQFWLGSSKWNRTRFDSLFSVFKDAIDLEGIWNNKHWHDYATKLYSTACDATWEYRLNSGIDPNPENVYSTVRTVLQERYPDKSARIWEVPKYHDAPAGETARKQTATGARSSPRRKISRTPPALKKSKK